MLVWILFMNTKRRLGLHAQTLGTVLSRGAQADARGATQVLGRGGQAAARGSCLSQVLDRGDQAAARGDFKFNALGNSAKLALDVLRNAPLFSLPRSGAALLWVPGL
jgi:hypothetical protein